MKKILNFKFHASVTFLVFFLGTVIPNSIYSQTTQAADNSENTSEIEKIRKARISKMTMNYIIYNRGMSSPVTTNIRIVEGSSDITYNNVALDDMSFFPDSTILPNAYAGPLSLVDIENAIKGVTEPYYGIKYMRFLESNPNFGLGVDFTHFKIFITDFNQIIHRTGTENGAPVDDYIKAGDYFKWFSVSHGINHISLTAIYRLMLFQTEKIPDGILQPFASVGFGPAIPHGELSVVNEKGYKIYGYKVAFPNFGFDLTLGLRLKPDPHFALNLEYKFSYSILGNIPYDNPDAGHVELLFPANHLQWGISFIF